MPRYIQNLDSKNKEIHDLEFSQPQCQVGKFKKYKYLKKIRIAGTKKYFGRKFNNIFNSSPSLRLGSNWSEVKSRPNHMLTNTPVIKWLSPHQGFNGCVYCLPNHHRD